MIRRGGFARPWPEGEPTRPGVRCELSDLLESECACRKHRKEPDAEEQGPREAEPTDLDFSDT